MVKISDLVGVGGVVQLSTLSLPTRVEVELGCYKSLQAEKNSQIWKFLRQGREMGPKILCKNVDIVVISWFNMWNVSYAV